MADYLLFEDLSSSGAATNDSNPPSSYVQAAPSSSMTMITYPIFTFYLVGVVTLMWILIQRIYAKYRIREMELVKDRKLSNKSLELHDSSNEVNNKEPRSIRRRKARADEETPFLSLTSEDSDDDNLFDFDAGGAAAEDLEESNSHNFLLRPRDIGFQLSFKNLGVRVEDGGKMLLEGVTGRLSSGKLTAVMGPSGAGKSTFLTTLSGRMTKGKVEGSVYLNNKKDDIGKYKRIVGFVPQDDIMLHELTVKETLRFSAETRLPSHVTREQKAIIVEEVLDILGLTEIRFLTIDKISGGQRKRVNIGMELVADPVIIFLDEPTSGLDSSSSKEVCSILRRLSALGLTLVAVIHQPRYEIFDLFDEVLLLGKGGKTVYLGPVRDVGGYFEKLGFHCTPNANLADFVMDILSGEVHSMKVQDSKQLTALWEEHNGEILDLAEKHASTYFDSTVDRIGHIAPELGNIRQFWLWFLLSVCLPFFFVPLALMEHFRPTSLKAKYGSLFGGLTSFALGSLIAMIVIISNTTSFDVFIVLFAMLCLGVLGTIVWLRVRYLRHLAYVSVLNPVGKDSDLTDYQTGFLGYFICGFCIGPFAIFYLVRERRLNVRVPLFAGFGFVTLIISSFWLIYLSVVTDTLHFGVRFGLFYFLAVCGTMVAALCSRHKKLPEQRRHVSFLFQIRLFFLRGLIQQIRSWHFLALDIFLPLLAAPFVGIFFYKRPYIGPLFTSYTPTVGLNVTCPAELLQYYPPLCGMMVMPLDDPLPSEASLTSLALALCAVASSLRVFGDERESFTRESSSGISTEAYYLGKSLAHLPVIFIAPLVFYLMYATFTTTQGPFWQHYVLLLLIYFTAAGVAYAVSIIVRPSISQLVGVLVVLGSMMFSGANPTLGQLEDNPLLGRFMFYPSYFSFIRYAQELYYLIEIKMYPYGGDAMTTLYQYSLTDWGSCWMWLISISFVVRLIAYAALVKHEK